MRCAAFHLCMWVSGRLVCIPRKVGLLGCHIDDFVVLGKIILSYGSGPYIDLFSKRSIYETLLPVAKQERVSSRTYAYGRQRGFATPAAVSPSEVNMVQGLL